MSSTSMSVRKNEFLT